MNIITQQEPWTPWEDQQQKVEVVVNTVGVEWRANLHENSFLSFAALGRLSSAHISTLQLNIPYSENQIGNPDSRKGNNFSILHLVVSISVWNANFSPKKNRPQEVDNFFVNVDGRSIFWSIFRAYCIPLLNGLCNYVQDLGIDRPNQMQNMQN